MLICLSDDAGMTSPDGMSRRMATLFGVVLLLIAWQALRLRPSTPPAFTSVVEPGEQLFPVAVPPGGASALPEELRHLQPGSRGARPAGARGVQTGGRGRRRGQRRAGADAHRCRGLQPGAVGLGVAALRGPTRRSAGSACCSSPAWSPAATRPWCSSPPAAARPPFVHRREAGPCSALRRRNPEAAQASFARRHGQVGTSQLASRRVALKLPQAVTATSERSAGQAARKRYTSSASTR